MTQFNRVLVDTGPLVAMRSVRDQHHRRVMELVPSLPAVLYTTWPVVTEAVYLLRDRPDEVRAILNGLGGIFQLVPQTDDAGPQIAAVIDRYADQGFSLADASLMVASAGGEFDAVFTVDRKDFSVWIDGERLPLAILD